VTKRERGKLSVFSMAVGFHLAAVEALGSMVVECNGVSTGKQAAAGIESRWQSSKELGTVVYIIALSCAWFQR